MITVVIDGGEGNRGEQLTEDTPTGRNVHAAIFTRPSLIRHSVSYGVPAATENEYVVEALPLPHPPLWLD